MASVSISTDTGSGKPGKIRDLGTGCKTPGISEKSTSKGNVWYLWLFDVTGELGKKPGNLFCLESGYPAGNVVICIVL